MTKFIPTTTGTFNFMLKDGRVKTVTILSDKNGLFYRGNKKRYPVDGSKNWYETIEQVKTIKEPVKTIEPMVHTIVAKTVETTVKKHRGRPRAILGVREFRTPSVLDHMKIDKEHFKVMIVPSDNIPEGAIIEQRKSMRKFTRCLDSESIILIKK